MSLMGLREYARHRNTYLSNVQRAIAAGRIAATEQGKIDSDVADPIWQRWEAEQHAPPGAPLLDAVPDLAVFDPNEEWKAAPMNPIPQSFCADVCTEPRVTETEARRRKEVALARLRELEVREKEARLVPLEDVTSTWVTVAIKIRDAVMRIPDKCAPAVGAAAGVHEVREVLRAECESILRTLSHELSGAD